MANITPFSITGFEELNAKLKTLPDKVKRREVLALQKRIAKPIQAAYAGALPKKGGTLAASVAIKSVSARRSGGNPTIEIVPGKKGKHKAYYKFMVIPQGTLLGSNERDSRKGKNTVTPAARDKALAVAGVGVTSEAERKIAEYIQKKINRL